MVRWLGRMTTWMALMVAGWLHAAGVAHAGAYPWVPIQDEVRMVGDPRLDLELRLHLIRQAQESIDLVLYEQGDDRAVGLPVLSALRQAADRGVRVRIITQWFFQYLYHPLNQSPSYTTNPPTAVPIEYVVFGSPESVIKHGWAPSDGIHGKVLIVDKMWALTTGRGHAEMNLRWVDTSFLFKGALVDQTVQAFDLLWEDAKRMGEVYQPVFPRKRPTRDQNTQFLPQKQHRLTGEDTNKFWDLVAWLNKPVLHTVATSAEPGGTRGRLLHMDFLRQMITLKQAGKAPWTWDGRLEVLKDPVVDAFVERLERTEAGSSVRMVSMYAMLHPRVKEAVIHAAKRGVKVKLFTNDDLTAPPISTLAYFASVGDIADVARAGPEVYGFQRSSNPRWDFLHLKLVVVDDTVIFGSHNLNIASSVANDEIAYEVDDPALAAEARKFFDHYAKVHGKRMSPRKVELARPLGFPFRLLLDPVLGFW